MPAVLQGKFADRFRTAIEQCEWADRLGLLSVALSEHHGSPDGYTPSPMLLVAGIERVDDAAAAAKLLVGRHYRAR